MFHDDSLNDTELELIERQLQSVALSPTSQQRERMLYACGHAAGRAQMKRRTQTATALAIALTAVSAGLGFVLINGAGFHRDSQDAAALSGGGQEVAPPSNNNEDNRLPSPQREWNGGRTNELTAASSFNELLLSDQEPSVWPPVSDPSQLVLKPVLTAAGSRSLDEF
jgi:hypothetical protein